MKPGKIVVIAALAYAGIVVAFESLIGVLQPEPGGTLVLTTYDEAGTGHERVVSSLESGGELFVAANHWPRAWYERALRNPEVEIAMDGSTRRARAEPVTDAERRRISSEHPLPLPFRIVTGFPPRKFLRLDPLS